MNVERDVILSCLDMAAQPGDILAPDGLMSAVAADPDPLTALFDVDRANALFGALTEEFGYIQAIRAAPHDPHADTRIRIAGLFRWTIQTLADWRPDSNPNLSMVVAAFVVTRYFEHAAPIWAHIPDGAANQHLQNALSIVLKNMQLGVGTMGFTSTPIADAESLARFVKADSASDWPTLASQLTHIDFHMIPSTFTSQAVAYLNRFDRERLVGVLSVASQPLLLIQMLQPFEDEIACRLALSSNNPRCEFYAMWKCVAHKHRRPINADCAERDQAIAELLMKVGQDDDKWSSWMQTFNRSPQTYPGIAKAMGYALARVPAQRLSAYIDAINLTTMRGNGRTVVAAALGVFRDNADLDRRYLLWSLAHEKWKTWNFGLADHLGDLTRIAHCELDYALVGYAAECLTHVDRQEVLGIVRRQLLSLNHTWFKSVIEWSRERNRLYSLCQPYAQSEVAPTEWLATSDYMPLNPENERYQVLLLSIV